MMNKSEALFATIKIISIFILIAYVVEVIVYIAPVVITAAFFVVAAAYFDKKIKMRDERK